MDEVIERLAGAQHGVVARWQLKAAGVGRGAIEHRVRMRRLSSLYPGVYGVGPVRGIRAGEWAALLACGETAVLSHHTSADLQRLLGGGDGRERIEVSVLRGHRELGRGVRIHRVSRLAADETTVHEGMPITTAARTILDLAPTFDEAGLERLIARAERLRLTDCAELSRLLARHPRRQGRRMLLAVLSHAGGPALTRSEAESRFLALVRRARLRAPSTNQNVLGYEVDFVWHHERLIAEVDGFEHHSSRRSFEADRSRDADLTGQGYRVIRLTWRQLTAEPEASIVRVARALSAGPAVPARSARTRKRR